MPNDFVPDNLIDDEEGDQNGHHLNPSDFQRASDVADIDPVADEGVDEDPILLANAFEGDILNVTKVEIHDMHIATSAETRNAHKTGLWPNNEVG